MRLGIVVLASLLLAGPGIGAERILVWGFAHQDPRASQWPTDRADLEGFDAVMLFMHTRYCWPEPKSYDFSWLDQMKGKADRAGVKLLVNMISQGDDTWLVHWPDWWLEHYPHLTISDPKGIEWGWWTPTMKEELTAFIGAWAAKCESLYPTVIAIRAPICKWGEPVTWPGNQRIESMGYTSDAWMEFVEGIYDVCRENAPSLDIIATVHRPSSHKGADWSVWPRTIDAAAERGFVVGMCSFFEEHETRRSDWVSCTWWNEPEYCPWGIRPENCSYEYMVEVAAKHNLKLYWEELGGEVNTIGELWNTWKFADKLAVWSGREDADTYYVCRPDCKDWKKDILPHWVPSGQRWKALHESPAAR